MFKVKWEVGAETVEGGEVFEEEAEEAGGEVEEAGEEVEEEDHQEMKLPLIKSIEGVKFYG